MAILIADVPGLRGEDAQRMLVTLTLLTGAVMLVAGLLRLGSVLRFVSNAVMVGFMSAVGVNIVLGQLADLTGYDADGANRVTEAFNTLARPDRMNGPTLAVGARDDRAHRAPRPHSARRDGTRRRRGRNVGGGRHRRLAAGGHPGRPRRHHRLTPGAGAATPALDPLADPPGGVARLRRARAGRRNLRHVPEPGRHLSRQLARLRRPRRRQPRCQACCGACRSVDRSRQRRSTNKPVPKPGPRCSSLPL